MNICWKDMSWRYLKASSVHFKHQCIAESLSLAVWSWQGFWWSHHVKCRRNWSYFHLLGHPYTGKMKGWCHCPAWSSPPWLSLRVVESCTASRGMPCWRMGKNTIPWCNEGNLLATHWPWIEVQSYPPKLNCMLWWSFLHAEMPFNRIESFMRSLNSEPSSVNFSFGGCHGSCEGGLVA